MPKNLSLFSPPYVSSTKYKSALILGILLSIAELLRIVGFVRVNIDYTIVIPLMILPIILLALKNKLKVTTIYLIFLLYIPLEIIISSPPAVFQSWQRFLLLALVICAVSPLIQNENLRIFRFYCLKYFILLILPLCAISFFCYFLGINFFTSQYGDVDYFKSVGCFSGLFKHSMVLGPMCAISTCTSVWLSFIVKKCKYVFIILAILCMGSTLFSASRAAVIGTVFASIIIILLYNRKRAKGIRILAIIAIIGTLSFPLWENALHGVNTKNSFNSEFGAYGSRTSKFTARISEIKSNPVFGIGFCAIDPRGNDYYDRTTGVIEPGSSWLGVISMTGVIGLIFILYFILSTYRILIKSNSSYAPLLIGLLTFFTLHLIFEGYIFAGGSILCFIFWLVIGVSTDIQYAKVLK